MVVTVEPGLYIPTGTPDVDPAYWGIGVRIEDDVLVTESGNEILTAAIPKEVADVEAVLRGSTTVNA
jgi:Xaa-Pro aminopeptidase